MSKPRLGSGTPWSQWTASPVPWPSPSRSLVEPLAEDLSGDGVLEDLDGSARDGGDDHVPEAALRGEARHQAVSAEDLHRLPADVTGHVRRVQLRHRDVQRLGKE